MLRRLRPLFRGARVERELDAELRFDIERRIEALVADGLSENEARRRVTLEFGGLDRVKEQCREARSVALVENFAQDLRYAFRMIVREPRFSIMLVLVLALGIGCATAMFSVLDRLLLRPIPSPVADRLVTNDTTGGQGDRLEYWAQSPALDGVSRYRTGEVNLTRGQSVERTRVTTMWANLFSLMEVTPLWGRSFLPEEETAGHDRVAILSYAFWQREYSGDRAVLGRSLTLNRLPYTIVGVMPASFGFPPQTQLFIPQTRNGAAELELDSRDMRDIFGGADIGRLRPGASLEQARAAYTLLFRRAQEPLGKTSIGQMEAPELLQTRLTSEMRLPLLALFGATIIVLLISCANAANLLLARAATRRKEIAVRVCLGAGRTRIVRQLLTESGLLAFCGGALGTLFSFAVAGVVRSFGARYISLLAELSVNGRLLAFAVGVSVLVGVVVGLAPALQAFAPDLNSAVKQESARTSTGGRQVMRKLLVTAQVALGVLLVVGAGLALQSFHRLMGVDKGFDEQHVVIGRITLPKSYDDPVQRVGYWERLQNQIRRLPGAKVTALSVGLPFITSGCGGGPLDLGAERGPVDKRYVNAGCTTVSVDYFSALGVPLRAGRLFAEGDGPGAPKVTIIDEAVAQTAWPGENPIGKHLKIEMEKEMREVVGVAGNVRFGSLDGKNWPHYYIPFSQRFRSAADLKATPYDARLVVRTASEPEKLIGALQNAVLSVDSEVPLLKPQVMEELVNDSVAAPRYRAWLLTGFGLVALLLSALGVYGVVSYSVACRRHELGVRVALGAQRRDILKIVMGEGARMAVIGAIIGLIAARLLTGFLTKLLFKTATTDPATFAAAAVVLMAVALVASLIPAHRATRLDPLVALRHE